MSFTRSYIDGTRGLQEPAEAFFFSMCLFESSVAGHSCFEPWFDLEHSYHCLLYTKWLLKLCLCFYSPLQRQQHHNHHHHQQQQDHTPELPVLRTVYTYDTYVRNRTLYACVQLLYSSSRTSVYLNPALEDAHPSALYREHSLIAALCGESQHIRSISTSLLKMCPSRCFVTSTRRFSCRPLEPSHDPEQSNRAAAVHLLRGLVYSRSTMNSKPFGQPIRRCAHRVSLNFPATCRHSSHKTYISTPLLKVPFFSDLALPDTKRVGHMSRSMPHGHM